MTKEIVPQLQRPENRGITERSGGAVQPWQLDPELAQIEIARIMIQKLGRPSRINKEFIARKALFKAINHRDPIIEDGKVVDWGNPTGLDFSMWIDFYEKYEQGSVNEDGVYFNNFWAYMMKPKYIIQGGGIGQMMPEEQKESIIGRIANWFRGGKKNDQPQQ